MVLHGNPSREIVRYAVRGKYDLVTLCTRGRGGLRRFVLGSVAEEVLRLSPIPVLVTHPTDKASAVGRIRRIVVPLDGSHRSASVLEPVSQIARAQGSGLNFVTVVPSTGKQELPVEVVSKNLFHEQGELRKDGLEVEITILYGDPATEILTFADHKEADLVAISTHGRTGLDRLRYGSVAESILRRGKFPLLVLRTAAIPRLTVSYPRALKASHRSLEAIHAAEELSVRGPYNR